MAVDLLLLQSALQPRKNVVDPAKLLQYLSTSKRIVQKNLKITNIW